jgi:polysaccharide biosynthesis/export protein
MQRLAQIAFLLYIIASCTSCEGIKNLQYVQGTFDTARLSKIAIPEATVQKGDLLSITVYSDDPLSTAAIVQQQQAPTPIASSTTGINAASNMGVNTTPGYQVDQQGNLHLYKLGSIPVVGMTKKRLADTLAFLYNRDSLLQNPYVDVRFLNYKVTLVGEVNQPGTYTIPTDNINIFEAIGLAGDITTYGRRDNLLVIREVQGVREFGKVDMSKPDVFASPYYYLKQNDIIIVDVFKNKAVANDQVTVRNITVAASILSTIAIFLNIFRR